MSKDICKHTHLVCIDFDLDLINIQPESSVPRPVCTLFQDQDDEDLDVDLNALDEPVHSNDSRRPTIIQDNQFLIRELATKIAELSIQNDKLSSDEANTGELIQFNSKLKSLVTSLHKMDNSGMESPYKKRKFSKQIRFKLKTISPSKFSRFAL